MVSNFSVVYLYMKVIIFVILKFMLVASKAIY